MTAAVEELVELTEVGSAVTGAAVNMVGMPGKIVNLDERSESKFCLFMQCLKINLRVFSNHSVLLKESAMREM